MTATTRTRTIWRSTLLVLGLATACSPVPPPDPPLSTRDPWATIGPINEMFVGTFVLVLTREYGLGNVRECRMTVDGGTVSSSCGEDAGRSLVRRIADERLGPDGASRVRRLATAADLYAGPFVGTDSTRVDVVVETLRVTNRVAESIVLVTSGNASFAGDRARNCSMS